MVSSSKRKYIFITDDIRPIGGMQLYVAGKSAYLENNGWDVTVLYPINSDDMSCAVSILEKYGTGGMYGIWRAPFQWGRVQSRLVLKDMLNRIGGVSGFSEIVVESNTSSSAQWGEMVARELHARHVCNLCNETFRGEGKTYDQVIPYFLFKLNRGELAGINSRSMPALFEGYAQIDEDPCRTFTAAELYPIAEIEDCRLNGLRDVDWTICHFGRAEKDYVVEVLADLGKFVRRHPDKTIRILFVGDMRLRRKEIDAFLRAADNIEILELGDMVPVPRSIFRISDVVIASSGCAMFSAAEGAITIVANCEDNMSNGVLGLETHDAFHRPEGVCAEGFDVSLERVLVLGVGDVPAYSSEFTLAPESVYSEQVQMVEDLSSPLGEYEIDSLFKPRTSMNNILRSTVNLLRNRLNRRGVHE